MHEPSKNITYLGKKLFFNFMGADFLAAKSGHRREKQPLLGLVILYDPKITERALERGWVPKLSQVYD